MTVPSLRALTLERPFGFPPSRYTKFMVKGGGRRRAKATFVTLGVCLVLLASALGFGWTVVNWRTGVMLVFGLIFFVVIITGVVLNTIFLVREIRRNEQHDAFINSVTHELKTPVASMRLYLETLQTREITDAKRRDFYDIMLADADRLHGTIEQVLRAARNSSHRQVERSRVDLREVLQECIGIARHRHHLPEEAIAYRESLSGSSTTLGDLDELKAAVSNLIDNAIKYSGTRVLITVELGEAGPNRLAVRVHDEGVGIAPAELKRIFRRFYRIPGVLSGKVKGTGLGLFIVRSVAERHGGRAYAESRGSGQGSRFTIELPASLS